MKTIVVLAVSIVLVSILFCPMVMSAPSMPADLQIAQPNPSLAKELAGFWGKWEGSDQWMKFFLIVEKIDEEKASLYSWRSGSGTAGIPEGWERIEAKVIKEGRKYKLWYPGRLSNVEYTLKGKYLDCSHSGGSYRLTRVP